MKTNEISKLLKKNNIKVLSYKKENDIYIVNTDKGKFFVMDNVNNQYIYDYLNTRTFDYYPKTVINDNYKISNYIEDTDIPNEQKYNDLIDLVALLHSKTTYYKNINNDEYLNIYNDLENNYNYLFEYYNDAISKIDNMIFLSPSSYLLARNIGLIFDSLNLGKEYLNRWRENLEKVDKLRVCVINNNLSLKNFKRNNKSYLINWNKSKIDIPVFDLYNFFQNNHDIDFYEILSRYEKKYPLKDIEKELLIILLLLPDKINFDETEYEKCIKIRDIINKLIKIQEMLIKKEKSIEKD